VFYHGRGRFAKLPQLAVSRLMILKMDDLTIQRRTI
jgi:hypothetical protein